jgi:dihydroneopterin aldolase
MKIKIKNLTQKMMIGVYDTEKIKPQSVIVNIEIDFYQGDSASTDDINDTLDYGLICKSVKKILLSRHYELIETVV